eukprot:6210809-Pleurochrysis_carterae.AAC.4
MLHPFAGGFLGSAAVWQLAYLYHADRCPKNPQIIAFPTLFLYGELVLFTFGAAMYSTSLPLAVVYIWLSSIILCAAGAFAAIWPSTALHVLFAAPVKLGTEEARVRCLLLFFIGMQAQLGSMPTAHV